MSKVPFEGGCVCGATRYRVTEEPLTLYACHCTDCQKRSGAAFGLSLWLRRAALELTQGEITRHSVALDDGRVSNARLCARCGTRLWSDPEKHPQLSVVRPGTLDDTSWLEPVAHIWTRSAQPWVVFPEGAVKYAKQPKDMRELIALWRARGQTGISRP